MKAISIWQPYATAIAVGTKKIETRSWKTSYTGPIAIHAAKKWTDVERFFAANEQLSGRLPTNLPLGVVVATANLIGCRLAEDVINQIGDIERMYGDYTAGRYAWFLTDVIALASPVPWRGSQRLFEIPDELLLT